MYTKKDCVLLCCSIPKHDKNQGWQKRIYFSTLDTAVSQKDLECCFCICIGSFLFPSPCAIQNSCLLTPSALGLLILYERAWIFSPMTWFNLCKIIASKALSYKLLRAEITFLLIIFFFVVHYCMCSSQVTFSIA